MNVKERLKKFIKSQSMTVSGFEKSINVSNGYVNSISKGIGGEILLTILEKSPNLNLNWLLMGEGEMLKEDEKELSEKEKRLVKPSKYHTQPKEIQSFISPKGIPLLPFNAFAEIGTDVEGINFDVIEERYVIPLFDGIKIDFMIPVRGASMYPKYSSGDVVACRLVKDILFFQWNKVYVLDTQSQGVIMKRVRESKKTNCITCVSDNEKYAPFDIPMEDVRNIALVVGVIRLE